MAKTADRIIETLVSHHPFPLTNGDIAANLGLPEPSVRRTLGQLRDNGMVFYHHNRGRAATFIAADYLTAGPTPHTAPIL